MADKRAGNPNYVKDKNLWAGYRIRYSDYQRMLEEQDYKCAICGSVEKLVVDHNHNCNHEDKGNFSCAKCVRQLLCQSCNKMLGFSKERKETLMSAINYIEMWGNE